MRKVIVMNRRTLLKTTAIIPLAAATASLSPTNERAARRNSIPLWRKSRVKLTCNLYSFNAPLCDKQETELNGRADPIHVELLSVNIKLLVAASRLREGGRVAVEIGSQLSSSG